MQFSKEVLLVVIVMLGGFASYGQNCSEDKPVSNNCRMNGKAKVYYFENQKLTTARIQMYLLGKAGDVKIGVNDVSIKNDVLILYADYFSTQNIKPDSIFLTLNSYSRSNDSLKYKDSQKLTIYADKNIILSENLFPRMSFGIHKSISLEIKLADFRRLAEAKRITINFVDSQIELNPEQIKAFFDLYKTTEGLSPRPNLSDYYMKLFKSTEIKEIPEYIIQKADFSNLL